MKTYLVNLTEEEIKAMTCYHLSRSCDYERHNRPTVDAQVKMFKALDRKKELEDK